MSEPKLTEENLLESFKKETDRSLNILLQLSNLQTRFTAIEARLVDLTASLAQWHKDFQGTNLRIQAMEQRIDALEKSNVNRSSKEWDLFKMMLPHVITLTIVGLLVKFGIK